MEEILPNTWKSCIFWSNTWSGGDAPYISILDAVIGSMFYPITSFKYSSESTSLPWLRKYSDLLTREITQWWFVIYFIVHVYQNLIGCWKQKLLFSCHMLQECLQKAVSSRIDTTFKTMRLIPMIFIKVEMNGIFIRIIRYFPQSVDAPGALMSLEQPGMSNKTRQTKDVPSAVSFKVIAVSTSYPLYCPWYPIAKFLYLHLEHSILSRNTLLYDMNRTFLISPLVVSRSYVSPKHAINI